MVKKGAVEEKGREIERDRGQDMNLTGQGAPLEMIGTNKHRADLKWFRLDGFDNHYLAYWASAIGLQQNRSLFAVDGWLEVGHLRQRDA